jgi:ATP-dependent Clp protease protease subunit
MHDFPDVPGLPGGFPFPLQNRGRDYVRQRTMTLSELLLENRIIFFGSVGDSVYPPIINDQTATIVIQQLLYLQYENRTQEIRFYINSPGGQVSSTLAIYDTMQFLERPIATYCVGMAASGAAVLLAAGTKGKRYALPHSKIMVHQPWGQIGGQASDVEIQMNEVIKEKQVLNEILAKHTGQPIERIEQETERDRYFSAQQAMEFGLVDEILVRKS